MKVRKLSAAGIGCVVAVGTTVLAEPPHRAWLREYTGPAGFYNNMKAVAADAEGNVYAAGESATGRGARWRRSSTLRRASSSGRHGT